MIINNETRGQRLYCLKCGGECVGFMCERFMKCKQRQEYEKSKENKE